jgi:uncharacterized membrane protein
MNQILTGTKRIQSVDILRGIVMVIMAIDHIRDAWALTLFIPEDMAQTTPGWFFTRWITHFCAPVFVFLAGTSAFLYMKKIQDKKELTSFLLSRGIWLVIVELIIMNLIISFEIPFTGLVFVQVIWVIAISMFALAGLIWLPKKWILAISLIMIAGHNLLDPIRAESFGSFAWIWMLLHEQGVFLYGTGRPFLVAYPIIPWIGVMGAGYVFGVVFTWDADRRKKFLLRAGTLIVLLFITLRFLNVYGDPSPWSLQRNGFYTLMDFLNTTKYPPSLLYLCMTLGPALLILVPLEHFAGRMAEALRIIGRVPFFYYIVHFFLVHILAVITYSLIYGRYVDFLNMMANNNFNFPEEYSPQVWVVYVVWGVLLYPLYRMCKWYNTYKFSRTSKWLKYI